MAGQAIMYSDASCQEKNVFILICYVFESSSPIESELS